MDEQLLFDRFHAALDVEPRPGAYERLRAALAGARPAARRRRWFGFAVELPQPLAAVLAALLIVAIVVAVVTGFLAIHRFVEPIVLPPPVHRVVPASGTCSYGFHMVSETTGWEGATMRSTDGGTTWQQQPTPKIANTTKGGYGECTLGDAHAWLTVAVTTPQAAANKNAPPMADHLQVLITVDGGRTWTEGGTVPASGINSGATFGFVSDQQGWLLVDSDTSRVLYGTDDGGYRWTRVSAPGSLDRFAGSCIETGMTFVDAERGWITWNCSSTRGSGPSGDPTLVVAATVDGGRTWAPAKLRGFSPGGGTCEAAPPVFTGAKGVLPLTCPGTGPGSWRGVFRSSDGGATWVLGSGPPEFFELSHIDFVDASVGFAFSGTDNDLYRTADSGRSWSVVERGVFPAQQLDRFQFVSSTTGFAYTSSSQGRPWKTTDGGRTWALAGLRTLPGNVGCPAAWAPAAGAAPVPVLMTNATTGWAAGALRTTDGGRHWTAPSLPEQALASSGRVEYFLDALHAWVAVATGSATACADHIVVYSTADGGSTWRQVGSLPVATGSRADGIWGRGFAASPRSLGGQNGPYLYFADPTHGWMIVTVGEPGFFMGSRSTTLYRTEDGGTTWTSLAGPAHQQCGSSQIGVVFPTATTGWMPGYACGAGDPLTLNVTHDAGDSWTLETLGPACGCGGDSPEFLDPRNGVLLSGPNLVVTSDGGRTWSARTVPSDMSMYGSAVTYSFSDPSHGWIVFSAWTEDGTVHFPLYRTTDGGRSWSKLGSDAIPASGADNVSGQPSVYFVDANHGFLAYADKLYVSADGGRTWSAIFTASA